MRKNNLIMLVVLIILYLGTSWTLGAIYGPSYGYLSEENSWHPDGDGGWTEYGKPTAPIPGETSVVLPIWVHYLPILIPGFLLTLFLFTPLRFILDGKPKKYVQEDDTGETAEAETGEEDRKA